MITILGPTATGKTSLAVQVAAKINAEIISADSRQVYRNMDIGTGKDLSEYKLNEQQIPYHLIDIRDAGYEYNVFEYQEDFYKAYNQITNDGHEVILCGGTGMYIEAILKGYKLVHVPINENFRTELDKKSHEELIELLSNKIDLHNTTDTSTKRRTIKAIEIATYYEENKIEEVEYPEIDNVVFGIHFERPELKKRITARLKERLESGMVEEVNGLVKSGVSSDKLKYYGLEYKFLTQYISGDLNYNDMFQKLNSAIHQFAKRQMTWFRKMERNGFEIQWIDGNIDLEGKVNQVLKRLKN